MKTEIEKVESVVEWRCRQLRESGFPSRLAAVAARDRRYDFHALIELAERGCRPDLAIRILAPIEEEWS